uniref:Uncharacterized protein n=1 Tax=Ditylenchus dipsaci TaxID=166011 RepID=A0A915EH99_9BILA
MIREKLVREKFIFFLYLPFSCNLCENGDFVHLNARGHVYSKHSKFLVILSVHSLAIVLIIRLEKLGNGFAA